MSVITFHKLKTEKEGYALMHIRGTKILLACLHNKNKSNFFGRPAFFQRIRDFRRFFKSL